MYNLSIPQVSGLLNKIKALPTILVLTKRSLSRFHLIFISFMVTMVLATGLFISPVFSAIENVNAPIWTRTVGQVNEDQLVGLDIDSTGNPIAVGYYHGTSMDFGGQSINSTQKDVFVAKYSTDGTATWVRSLGGSSIDEGRGIAVDSSDAVYITGNFRQTVDLGSGNRTSQGGDDIFVSKFDSNGNLQWGWDAGGVEVDQGWDVAVDTSQNVYATGFFSGSVNFGGTATTTITSTNVSNDVFIVGLNPNGTFRWFNYVAGESGDRGNGIAVDSTRNAVYVTGFIQSDSNFNPLQGGSLLDTSARDIFLAKYNATTGDFIKTIIIGDPGSRDFGQAVAVDETTGTVYLTGAFDGFVDFDPSTGKILAADGRSDVFVAAYNDNLDLQWAVNVGGSGEDVGEAIAIGSDGNIYVSGWFAETADFDPDSAATFEQTSAGDHDAFVLTLDSAGQFLAVSTLGGPNRDQSLGLAVDADQRLYHGGFFQGTIDVNPTELEELVTGGGQDDIFLTALSSNLAPRADGQSVSVDEDSALEIVLTGSDPQGEAISITLTAPNSVSGMLSGLSMTGANTATVTYTPNPNFAGSDSFDFLVTDASGFSASGTVNIAVTNINDAPTADDSLAFTTNEDTLLAVDASNGLLSGSTSDPDTGDTLTASAEATSTKGATVIANADGGLSYDPSGVSAFQALAVGESTTDTINFTVMDSSSETDSATATITIEGQNDAPVANDDGGYTTPGSTPLNAALSVLNNDNDVDASDVLTVDTQPVTLPTSGAVTLNTDGTFVYTPATGFTGIDTFTYRVTDGNGGEATATVTISVGDANVAPTLTNSTSEVESNGTLTGGSLLNSATDANGDTLTVGSTPLTPPTNGTVVIGQDGTYTYTPNAGYVGSDSFTYQVCDNGTPVLCSEGTVTITVRQANQPEQPADTIYVPTFIH